MRFFIPAVLLLSQTAFADPKSTLQCQDIGLTVTAQALNKKLPDNLKDLFTINGFNKLTAAFESLPTQLVGGTYTISARYCEPLTKVEQRQNTLQILVHGLTYDKDYWSGVKTSDIGAGHDEHSWVYYAAQQGYSTLTIDRLCNGKSSRPNGIIECQLPLQAAIIQEVIAQARSGKLPSTPVVFGRIIYAGHSFGSLVGNYISATYPDSIDQLHLTGFTEKLAVGGATVAVNPGFLPANIFAPVRFPSLDPSYLVPTSKSGVRKSYYYGDFSDAMADYEFPRFGTATVGEMVSVSYGQMEAPGFKGDVFVLNGDNDEVFCGSDAISAVAGKPGQCGGYKYSEDVGKAYPNSRQFGFYNVPSMGHVILSNNNGIEGIKHAHEFMAETGF